jgi:hypothetical protein
VTFIVISESRQLTDIIAKFVNSHEKRLQNHINIEAFRPTLGPILTPVGLLLGDLASEIERPGRDADGSPFSAKVKYCGALHPHPHQSLSRGAQLTSAGTFHLCSEIIVVLPELKTAH